MNQAGMECAKLFTRGRDQARISWIQFCDKIKRSKWKNEKPKNNLAYMPTFIEHVANIITHGVAIIPSLWMSKNLLLAASTPLQVYCAGVYGLVLTGLFSVSTVFHTVAACSSQNSFFRDVMHRCDRAMIYLFIAGAYTPWLNLRDLSGATTELRWAVWVLATIGITYQQIFHEKYKALETTFYVVIALFPSTAVFEMDDTSGIPELQLGGLIYLLGVVFFKCDGVIPLAHAIWHVHVVVGSMIHYYAVQTYLMN